MVGSKWYKEQARLVFDGKQINKVMDNIEKLRAISAPSKHNWIEIEKESEKEDLYMEKSVRVAVNVLSILREKGMTKQELAERMGVSPQYVSRIVKGSENLTIETISKLEMALDCPLVSVLDYSESLLDINQNTMSIIGFPSDAFNSAIGKKYHKTIVA